MIEVKLVNGQVTIESKTWSEAVLGDPVLAANAELVEIARSLDADRDAARARWERYLSAPEAARAMALESISFVPEAKRQAVAEICFRHDTYCPEDDAFTTLRGNYEDVEHLIASKGWPLDDLERWYTHCESCCEMVCVGCEICTYYTDWREQQGIVVEQSTCCCATRGGS